MQFNFISLFKLVNFSFDTFVETIKKTVFINPNLGTVFSNHTIEYQRWRIFQK